MHSTNIFGMIFFKYFGPRQNKVAQAYLYIIQNTQCTATHEYQIKIINLIMNKLRHLHKLKYNIFMNANFVIINHNLIAPFNNFLFLHFIYQHHI